MDDDEWLALLRTLDEPLPESGPRTPVGSFMRPVPGRPGMVRLDEAAALAASVGTPPGWETPRDFHRDATQARFDRLAERLGEVFGVPLTAPTGPQQDAAHFADVTVPAEATATRAKGSRQPYPVAVRVSTFGGLVTVFPVQSGTVDPPALHPHDRDRVEAAATALGYLVVPDHVLALFYDGPNAAATSPMTWWTRYFGYL